MPARACGTMRTERDSTTSTNRTTTPMAINAARLSISSSRRPGPPNKLTERQMPWSADQSGSAVDPQHTDRGALLEHAVRVVATRGPDLAGQLDPTTESVHPVGHQGVGTDQRGGPGAQLRGVAQVPQCHRTQQ